MINDDGSILPLVDLKIYFVRPTDEQDENGPVNEEVEFMAKRNGMLFLTAGLPVIKEASSAMQGTAFKECCEEEEGEGNVGNEGIDDDADIEGDEDEEDKDRDDEGKTTARAMKRTSLERNDYEEEGDVGQDNDGECQEDDDNDDNEDDEDNDGEIGEIATIGDKDEGI